MSMTREHRWRILFFGQIGSRFIVSEEDHRVATTLRAQENLDFCIAMIGYPSPFFVAWVASQESRELSAERFRYGYPHRKMMHALGMICFVIERSGSALQLQVVEAGMHPWIPNVAHHVNWFQEGG